MSNEELFKRLSSRIDTYRDYIIEVQRMLTAIPALAPPRGEGEQKKAEAIKALLKELGITDTEEYKAPDPRVPCGYRPNLVARIKGEDRSRTLWLMAHMDVVDPGKIEDWSSDPWQIRVDGDRIFGRGVEDNHQGIMASLCLAKAIQEEKITPPYDLALLFVADEETGNELGIGHLLDHHQVFGQDDLIIVPDGGLPDGTQIEVAEKGIIWLELVVKGKQCHGSMPDKGVNAHRAAAHLVTRLDSLYKAFDKEDPVFDPPMSTFEPTIIRENVKSTNIIPGEHVFHMDCRVLPDYPLSRVKEEVEKICRMVEEEFTRSPELRCEIAVKAIQQAEAAPPTPTDAAVVKALEKAVKEVYGVEARPMGIGGGTVAAFIRKKGFKAAVWARMDETMHAPNEYCYMSNLMGDAKVFAHVLTMS